MIGKKNRKKYFIGTQDSELKRYLRHIPSVPLMYFVKGLLSLEEPSEYTKGKSERKEEIKSQDKSLKPLLTQLWQEKKEAWYKEKLEHKDKDLNKLKAMFPFKKVAKGPNPLSCKKKKQKEISVDTDRPKKKTRRSKKPKD